MEKRPLMPQQLSVAQGAPDQAAQHVAAVDVGGDDAFGHEHRRRAAVIGDDAESPLGLGRGSRLDAEGA